MTPGGRAPTAASRHERMFRAAGACTLSGAITGTTRNSTSRWSLDAYAPPVEDEDRQWAAVKAVTRDFIGLPRAEAEELAAELGLHPTVLDWDVLKEPVARAFTTRDDIIVLWVHDGVVTRAEPR